jgi:hypothetical protein
MGKPNGTWTHVVSSSIQRLEFAVLITHANFR